MESKIIQEVRQWMQLHISEYVDECNEINCTKMAEEAAEEFDLYENDDYDICEWVFDLAGEIEIK